jgi:hypothetical protein
MRVVVILPELKKDNIFVASTRECLSLAPLAQAEEHARAALPELSIPNMCCCKSRLQNKMASKKADEREEMTGAMPVVIQPHWQPGMTIRAKGTKPGGEEKVSAHVRRFQQWHR